MNEELQLALTVGVIALGCTAVVGILGYLIEKNSGEEAEPPKHMPKGNGA